MTGTKLRAYHAPVWDEPVIMEMGYPGRRGHLFPKPEPEIVEPVGPAEQLVPPEIRRGKPPALPELSEFEVQRHYLHLSQETLGMMGVSLFGTCTMKYNARLGEILAGRPELAEVHPLQPEDTLQGVLEILHSFDLILRSLSGMDQFIFQPGGGADASYTHCAITRAFFTAKGELDPRDEIVTSIQAHPCNPATAAAAGFKVVTLPIEANGYPSLDALKAAVSERTAALMIGNPDDMGIYNPEIKEWVQVVHEAGGLCFYDHANFNGVMGKLSARELGFDACMFMLHKTFGAPKGGGGPAVGAYGCTAELAPFLPTPVVIRDGDRYRLDIDRPKSAGKVREFWGNVPQIVKAYAWARAMGAEGINEASDLSVLANNYMDKKLAGIRGLAKSHPHLSGWRMEMTRWSLGPLKEETGIGTAQVANRMADYGIDPYWMSHEPWLVPEPFTPEAGELFSLEDIDRWIATLARICEEAYADPELVRTAPHNQAIKQLRADALEDPERWAMTWRAYVRKHRSGGRAGAAGVGTQKDAAAAPETGS
jgi:glycine dehydrogenase subunit 2